MTPLSFVAVACPESSRRNATMPSCRVGSAHRESSRARCPPRMTRSATNQSGVKPPHSKMPSLLLRNADDAEASAAVRKTAYSCYVAKQLLPSRSGASRATKGGRRVAKEKGSREKESHGLTAFRGVLAPWAGRTAGLKAGRLARPMGQEHSMPLNALRTNEALTLKAQP